MDPFEPGVVPLLVVVYRGLYELRLTCTVGHRDCKGPVWGTEVAIEHISRDTEEATGTALIIVDGEGENLIAVASGANARLRPTDVRAAERAICGADLVLLQLEVPLETVLEAIGTARRASANATSCGVATTTAPVSGIDCASVSGTSPVPGGRSITR